MSKKDIKLTNWQVPRDPKEIKYDRLKRAPKINMDDYENIVKEQTREESIKIAEAIVPAMPSGPGMQVPEDGPNLGGIKDGRKKIYWKPNGKK